MATKIIHKKSSVAASVPVAADIAPGELALNLADQKIYSKQTDGTIVEMAPTVAAGYLVKTTTYTAVANDNIIANTSGGVFTITLPASPSAGDTVVIADGASWATNNLTVARNGSTIEGDAEDMAMDIDGVNANFVYDGTTWQVYAHAGITTNLTAYTETEFTATASQTTFTVDYTAGKVDVHLNGVKLANADYTATNGTTIVLTTAAAVNDILNVVAWNSFTPADIATSAQGALADSALQSYTVSQGDVTGHQAALSITESQISDLQSYITGYTVTQGDVTGHQAALSITESQISNLGSYETADATILKDADIGVNVLAYDANVVSDASYVATANDFTTVLKNKLDGVEASATADQTAAEIKTAYLSNSDTNVFDDNAHDKLNAIAANATNVTNNNQITNGAGFTTYTANQAVNTTSSPTFVTANVTTVDLGNWTVTESGGSLYFATSGTNKMKLDASGNLDIVGSVNSNATIT